MAKTFSESRPTSVSVIGWAWIIIGAMMLFSAVMGLVASGSLPAPRVPAEVAATPAPFARIWNYILPLAILQACAGALGIVVGKRLLALEAWARTVAEVLSWLLALMLVSMTIGWVRYFLSIGADEGVGSFVFVPLIMSVFVLAMYGAPLGLMIHRLRSAEVREAVSAQ